MKKDDLVEMIDAYLRQTLSDKERSEFIEAIKKDVDQMIELETTRAVSIKTRSDEKKKLVDRFKQDYSSSKSVGNNTTSKVIPYTEERDDRILEFMNAAFAKNINILENEESTIDWETIVKFLHGDDDDD